MDRHDLRTYLLDKKGVTAERPFGPDVAVYKVLGKTFALITAGAASQLICFAAALSIITDSHRVVTLFFWAITVVKLRRPGLPQ